MALTGGRESEMPHRWQVPAASAAVLSAIAAYVIHQRDPTWSGTSLWLASMSAAVIAAVAYVGHSGWVRRVGHAVGWQRVDTAALVGLGVVALVIRTHRLGISLPHMHGDEGEMGMLARQTLHASGSSPLPVFRTAFLDHPTLFHYVQAGALTVFGDSITGLRLLSAMSGALAAPGVYLVGRLGWGRVAGVTAGWLLCVSHFHIQYSRIALNNIESSTAIVVAIVLVLAAVVLGRHGDQGRPAASPVTLFVLLGLVVGVSQYFYYGSRLLIAMTVPILLLLRRRGVARWSDLLAAAGAFLLAALPLVLQYERNPAAFTNRTNGVSVFGAEGLAHELGPGASLPGDLPRLLGVQLRENIAFFVGTGDRSAFYSARFPAFDGLTVVLFWSGIAMLVATAVLQRRIPGVPSRVILVWLVLGVTLGGIMTNDPPNGPRLLMVVPAVFVTGGVAAQYGWNALERHGGRAKSVAVASMVALSIVTWSVNWNRYFVEYAEASSTARITEVATVIRDASPTDRVFLIGGDQLGVRHGVVRFVTDGGDQSDLVSAADFEAVFPELQRVGRPVLVIALETWSADLHQIRRTHPGGTFATYTEADGTPSFATYEVPLTGT